MKQIEKTEAARLIAPEFREVPETRFETAALESPRVRERRQKSAALEFLENEFIDSGIIINRGNSLEFWHLTFQEYLAARACAGFDVPADELLKDDRWNHQEWREVMLLLPGVLIHLGQRRVDAIFNAMLDRAEEASSSLAMKARIAGLLGAALQDLRPDKYRPPDEARYNALLRETLELFDKGRVANIDQQDRIKAAEALGQSGDPRLKEDNWVSIAGGKFLMGAQKTSQAKSGYDVEAQDFEGPVREVSVEPFQIGRYPVTVQEFASFVEDDENGYPSVMKTAAPNEWDEQILVPNRPVVYVNWHAANAYCKWMTAKTGITHRLPTEAEWEFAARGTEGRKYPWGNQAPDTDHSNYKDLNVGSATPVGLFPKGATPEGLEDMAGNVFEWTMDSFGKNNFSRVIRGGSWYSERWYLRGASRGELILEGMDGDVGFRCVRLA